MILIDLFRIVALLAFVAGVNGFFSISYQPAQNENAKMMNFGSTFVAPPTADQVADVYSRLSCRPPLLWEDQVDLPAIKVDGEHAERDRHLPVLLEVHGGVLPRTSFSVIRSSAFDSKDAADAPKLADVLSSLANHGIQTSGRSMEGHGDKINDVKQYLEQQDHPVIILHHETPAGYHYQRALVSNTTSNSTVVPLTEFQISQYQICLWAAVLFVILLFSAVCSIATMEAIPDNILYAKFQSGRTEKRD